MEKKDVFREFFTDLIRPIVQEAVKECLAPPAPNKDVEFITVKEILEDFPISHTQLYREINSGCITKYKIKRRTAFNKKDIVALFKPESLTGISGNMTFKSARA